MWGVDNWGEMIWGGASPVPLMSPLGFFVLAVLLIVTGVVMQRRHASKWAMWTLGAAVVVIPLAAYAGSIAIPNTFTNGTVADADEVNANFDAVETAVNDNDGRITTAQGTADTGVADAAAAQSAADAAQGTADTCYSWGDHAGAGYVLQGQADSITSTMIGSGEVSSSDLQDGACLAEIADDDGAGSGLDADALDGYQAGNASGQVAVSNGTKCTDLNADKLDDYHRTEMLVPAHHSINATGYTCSGESLIFANAFQWIFISDHTLKTGNDICGRYGLTCTEVMRCTSSSGGSCNSFTSIACVGGPWPGRYWPSGSGSQNGDAYACCQ